ncbi:MAG: hypothetical protein AAFV53_10550 [Myxococcota bacterium]
MLTLTLWLLTSPARAGGYLGADYLPFGRGDLVTVDDGQTSGTGLSEGDGILQPPLTVWGGWRSAYTAWLFGLSAGWDRTVIYSGQQRTLSSQGGVRPSVDQRIYLRATHEPGALPWLQWGAYGTIPWAREESTAWTEEEQAAFQDAARERRGRIGGYGVRVGGGVEVGLTEQLYIGVRALLVIHQGVRQSGDQSVISTQLRPENGLSLGWRL